MKKSIIALSLLTMLFVSCSKPDSTTPNSTNNTNNTTSTEPNKITLNLNGQDYTIKGASRAYANRPQEWPIVCGVPAKNTDYSFISFEVGATTGTVAFKFDAYVPDGPLDGIGTYNVAATGSITENFSGGQKYDIQGGTATVTKNDTEGLIGTIQMNVSNSGGSKVVNGSFEIKDFKY